MDEPEPARAVSWLDSAGSSRQSGLGGGPAREGRLAASHLEGLLRFMQVGPPPSSRTAHAASRLAVRQHVIPKIRRPKIHRRRPAGRRSTGAGDPRDEVLAHPRLHRVGRHVPSRHDESDRPIDALHDAEADPCRSFDVTILEPFVRGRSTTEPAADPPREGAGAREIAVIAGVRLPPRTRARGRRPCRPCDRSGRSVAGPAGRADVEDPPRWWLVRQQVGAPIGGRVDAAASARSRSRGPTRSRPCRGAAP